MLTPGTVFASDYRVERTLSSGGMGSVYVVDQLSTGRKRALKLMLPELVKDARLRERFAQEAKIGARIDSEHVVEVIAAGVDPEQQVPFLVMELLDGETLAAHLLRKGTLTPAEVSDLFGQMCHALGAAHAAGIVHRDLKPDNVLLCRTKRADVRFTVKILDFGIAKLLAEAKTAKTSAMGTPLWMAPEQSDHKGGITPAADVWPLGLIAFRALAGIEFWECASAEDATVHATMREVLFSPIVPASVRAAALGAAALPEGFDGWFAAAVERDASKRFPNATVAFEALRQVLSGTKVEPAATAVAQRAGATVLAMPADEAFGSDERGLGGRTEFASPVEQKGGTQLGVGVSGPINKTASSSKPPLWMLAAGGLALVGVVGYVATRSEPKPKPAKVSEEEPRPSVRPIASPTASTGAAVAPVQAASWRQEAIIPVSSDDPALGPKNAPVTIVAFGSYSCFHCIRLHPSLHAMRVRFGDQVRIVWKDFAFTGDGSAQAMAALGRTIFRKQGHAAFWKFHAHFDGHAGGTESSAEQAKSAAANSALFEAFARDNFALETATLRAEEPASTREVEASSELARKLQITGLPHTFLNGLAIGGSVPAAILEAGIETELTAVNAARAGGLAAEDTYVRRVQANYVPPPPEAEAPRPIPMGAGPGGASPAPGAAAAPRPPAAAPARPRPPAAGDYE